MLSHDDVNPKFDHIMNLDYDVHVTHTQIYFGAHDKTPLLAARKAKFFAALDALTPEELVEFRKYRAARR